MKNRYSFWMNKLWIVGFMTGCLTLSSCDDEKDLTTGMPENQLINNIVLKSYETIAGSNWYGYDYCT